MADTRPSYAQIIVAAFKHCSEKIPLCLLHENMLNCRTVKAGTNVTIGVPGHVFNPNDAMWFTLDAKEQAASNRKPKYVGIIVFLPIEEYENPKIDAPQG